jgi:hypothetical protein
MTKHEILQLLDELIASLREEGSMHDSYKIFKRIQKAVDTVEAKELKTWFEEDRRFWCFTSFEPFVNKLEGRAQCSHKEK